MDVHVLWRNRMASDIRGVNNAETILYQHSFVKSLELLLRRSVCFGFLLRWGVSDE